MRTAARRLALVLLAACTASGCTMWGAQPAPDPSSSRPLPDPVRVTRADASTLVVFEPAVSGDSLVGYTGQGDARQRVAVPMSDVRALQSRRTNVAGTAALAAGITFVIGFLALGLATASGTDY